MGCDVGDFVWGWNKCPQFLQYFKLYQLWIGFFNSQCAFLLFGKTSNELGLQFNAKQSSTMKLQFLSVTCMFSFQVMIWWLLIFASSFQFASNGLNFVVSDPPPPHHMSSSRPLKFWTHFSGILILTVFFYQILNSLRTTTISTTTTASALATSPLISGTVFALNNQQVRFFISFCN